jgi:nitrate reductase gamma subunit
MHILISAGFLILLVGSILVMVQYDTPLDFLKGNFYLIFSLILDIAGAGIFIGLCMAFYRRFILKPEKLDIKKEDKWILLLFIIIVVSGFIVEGLRIAIQGLPRYELWSPIGFVIAIYITKLWIEKPALQFIHQVFWIIHAFLTCVFIYILATTRLRYIFFAPLNIFFFSKTLTKRCIKTYFKYRICSISWCR